MAEQDASLILSADVTVPAGEHRSLFFLYGYLPGGLSQRAVAAAVGTLSTKYRTALGIVRSPALAPIPTQQPLKPPLLIHLSDPRFKRGVLAEWPRAPPAAAG